jgi:phage tail sheath protein FI
MLPQEIKEWRNTVYYDSSRAALYYPWIEIADQTGSNGSTRLVPPSGHVAGVYARVDGTRGVHKAPANEIIRTCLGLEVQVTKGEQSLLNPIGVNCIRSFPGRGIRIWGARTLSSDASWRYVPVRRLFNMIEESIERGTQWVVFEPNDQFLWGRVRRDVGSFLKMVWGTGALFGASPADAFYVKCDAETNPPELRDLGQMVVEIGIAPVKPAEFVIFRISQWSPSAE